MESTPQPRRQSATDDVRVRLLKYEKNAETLRQIHSNKHRRFSILATLSLASTLFATVTVSFIGFVGFDIVEPLFPAVEEWTATEREAIEHIVVLLLLIAVVLDPIFAFREKAHRHHRSIVILTGFIRDVTDAAAAPTDPSSEDLREFRERYKLITEILPPSSDREYYKSKRDLAKKDKLKLKLQGRSGSNQGVSPTQDDFERHLAQVIRQNAQVMAMLRVVSNVATTECWITGGAIRNLVWDCASGFTIPTPPDDVDVIYFSKDNITEDVVAASLRRDAPNIPWSVANQASAHERTNDEPWASLEDAIAHFPETASAIAVRLEDNQLRILAPHGLDDLFRLVVRPTPHFSQELYGMFEMRARTKKWTQTWPKLVVASRNADPHENPTTTPNV